MSKQTATFEMFESFLRSCLCFCHTQSLAVFSSIALNGWWWWSSDNCHFCCSRKSRGNVSKGSANCFESQTIEVAVTIMYSRPLAAHLNNSYLVCMCMYLHAQHPHMHTEACLCCFFTLKHNNVDSLSYFPPPPTINFKYF